MVGNVNSSEFIKAVVSLSCVLSQYSWLSYVLLNRVYVSVQYNAYPPPFNSKSTSNDDVEFSQADENPVTK